MSGQVPTVTKSRLFSEVWRATFLSLRPATLAAIVILPRATLSLRSILNVLGRLLSGSATQAG